MPKISTSDFKNGLTLQFPDDIYTIIEFLHVKPGKGGAFVRSKIKGITNGKTIERTFRAGETLESVRVERHPHTYLYNDGDVYYFMHQETYEQIGVNSKAVDRPEFMKESEQVYLVFNADTETVLFTELPDHVILEIADTEPGLKGDTATGAVKQAKLETGAVINVPLFINTGDRIKVDARNGSYIERVKS